MIRKNRVNLYRSAALLLGMILSSTAPDGAPAAYAPIDADSGGAGGSLQAVPPPAIEQRFAIHGQATFGQHFLRATV
jgi:hypothetical protein